MSPLSCVSAEVAICSRSAFGSKGMIIDHRGLKIRPGGDVFRGEKK